LPAPRRGEYLFKGAEIFDGKLASVAEDMTREEGKTLPEATAEVKRTVNIFVTSTPARRVESLSARASTFDIGGSDSVGVALASLAQLALRHPHRHARDRRRVASARRSDRHSLMIGGDYAAARE
jgi:hypothetical protein